MGDEPPVSTGTSLSVKRIVSAMPDKHDRCCVAVNRMMHSPRTTEGSGMDPYRFGYSPIIERPKLSWPKGARVAVWVCPNIEHYEYVPAEVRVRYPWPRMPHPDVLGYGGRDYGNRVGLWRMFEVLDKHSIRCPVSLSMSVIEMYPEILEAMEARRREFMSHGYFITRYLWGYAPEDEREVIEHSKATHLRLPGRKLRGWFSPAVSNTLATPDI